MKFSVTDNGDYPSREKEPGFKWIRMTFGGETTPGYTSRITAAYSRAYNKWYMSGNGWIYGGDPPSYLNIPINQWFPTEGYTALDGYEMYVATPIDVDDGGVHCSVMVTVGDKPDIYANNFYENQEFTLDSSLGGEVEFDTVLNWLEWP